MKEYISKFLSLLYVVFASIFVTVIYFGIVAFWGFLLLALLNWASLKYFHYPLFYILHTQIFYIISLIIVLFVYTFWVIENYIESEGSKIREIEREKNDIIHKLTAEKNEITDKTSQEISELKYDNEIYKQSLLEKSSGFPTLLSAIAQYEGMRDEVLEEYLIYKKHPSLKGSEVVKEQSARRRYAEFELRKTKAIIEYYESIAPFLLEYKDDIILPENEDLISEYSDEEKLDPAINYLTKQEYRKLSSIDRNQMALDRFWKRQKSNWLLGRIYERYIGYIYEENGYDVEYVGIFKGYEDLGRDLICTKKNEIVVVQCKNWSRFKTIYEKHIFQFFGTVFQYKDENKNKKVNAVFYTTTKLSDLARRFAKELGIGLKEEFKMENNYPCIKCNISRVDGTKIYHLPFDQKYDNVKIERHKGEFYCTSVKEAEDAGFRRAFRYKGLKKN